MANINILYKKGNLDYITDSYIFDALSFYFLLFYQNYANF